MMAQLINRRQVKSESRELLRQATVPAAAMVALLFLLQLVLNLVSALGDTLDNRLLGTFFYVLTYLMGLVLSAGFVLYCMTVRRREHAEYMTLFDGFSMVGKVVSLYFLEAFYIAMWTMLFIFPGFVAAYRYRFAMYNLLENPELSIFQALELSKRQTLGYKMQAFLLDFSYFGWIFLADLPLYLVNLSYSMSAYNMEAGPLLSELAYASPILVTLVTGLWTMLINCFFYANRICSDLEYYEIAKTTSGLTAFSDPYQPSSNPT